MKRLIFSLFFLSTLAQADFVPEVISYQNSDQATLDSAAHLVNDRYASGYSKFFLGGYANITSSNDIKTYLNQHHDAHLAVLRDSTNDGEVIASVLIRLNENRPEEVMLHRFAASDSPRYKGQGIGKRILDFAEVWSIARNPNARDVKLEAFKQADTLVNYYKKIGYREVIAPDGRIEERVVSQEDQERATPEFYPQRASLAYLKLEKTRPQILGEFCEKMSRALAEKMQMSGLPPVAGCERTFPNSLEPLASSIHALMKLLNRSTPALPADEPDYETLCR